MLSYQHAYHASNLADVRNHATLVEGWAGLQARSESLRDGLTAP